MPLYTNEHLVLQEECRWFLADGLGRVGFLSWGDTIAESGMRDPAPQDAEKFNIPRFAVRYGVAQALHHRERGGQCPPAPSSTELADPGVAFKVCGSGVSGRWVSAIWGHAGAGEGSGMCA